jgi:hypothetical protein
MDLKLSMAFRPLKESRGVITSHAMLIITIRISEYRDCFPFSLTYL